MKEAASVRLRGLGTTVRVSPHRSAVPSSPLDGVTEVRGVKAQWHSTSPFHSQPLIHHDKCAQMIWPSSTNGERRARTSFAQDPLQLIHPALLWANWSGALPACVLVIYPTHFNGSCFSNIVLLWGLCRLCRRGAWGYKMFPCYGCFTFFRLPQPFFRLHYQ